MEQGSEESKEKFKITAAEIKALLAEKFSDTRQYVSAAEVGCQTGYSERRIDFMAMHCFESEGLRVEAFEVKISKPDLRRELMDPDKHAVFFDEIDTYSIVAPFYVLDDLSIIPPKWGVYQVVTGDDGKPTLKTKRKPIALHDEQTWKRTLSRSFAASFFRAVNNQSAEKARMIDARRKMEADIRKEIEGRMVHGAHIVSDYEFREMSSARDLCRRLDLGTWSRSSTERDIRKLAMARKVVSSIGYLDEGIAGVERDLRNLREDMARMKQLDDGADDSRKIVASESSCMDPSADAHGILSL